MLLLVAAAAGIWLLINPPQVNDFKCRDFTPGLQDPIKPTLVNGTDEKTYDVIVIGAGVAGLEAAHELDSEGKKVVVLEARDRVGGRLWTDHYSDYALDMGGSWIHGLNANSDGLENPIYKIATTNNIIVKKTNATEINYDSSGKLVDDDSFNEYHNKYEQFVSEEEERTIPHTWKTTTVEDVMNKFGTFKNLNETELAKLRHVIEGNIDMELGTSSNETSLENILWASGTFREDTETEVIFPEGYNQIVNCLAGGLDIRHANVTKVNYAKHPIVVSTDKEGDFKAKYVVSTLPVEVLKNNAVDFSPPFLENKTNAINNLRMGTMDKVYLIFNKTKDPFWNTDKTWINRISYDKREDGTYDTSWKYFFNMHKYTGQPILLAFNTADSAVKLENEDDDSIKRQVTEVLRKMYPNKTIPEPEKIVRTKWAEDPLSRGSYSFIGVGGSLSDIDELAKPIDNKLFFAGEATSPYYYGSVHAAYITGYRAAQEILKLENNVDSPREQLEHGIYAADVICPKGFSVSDEESSKTECILE